MLGKTGEQGEESLTEGLWRRMASAIRLYRRHAKAGAREVLVVRGNVERSG